jgi:hypothetical protein
MLYNTDFVSLMTCLIGWFLGYLMSAGVYYRASHMDSLKIHKSLTLIFNGEHFPLITLRLVLL